VIKVEEGKDTRDEARYHIKMIMGTQHFMIIDNKFTRSLRLDVSPKTIGEQNYAEIFVYVVEALRQSSNIDDGEGAACITFPAGTIQVQVPGSEQA
jgi:hypothetical protein